MFQQVLDQGRLLGLVGSIVIIIFLGVIFYSIVGSRRILEALEKSSSPMQYRMSERHYHLFLSLLRIVAASLIPLLLLALFSFVRALIEYDAAWFLLVGEFLKLWALGALVISVLREGLLSGLLPIPAYRADPIYRVSRIVVLYILLSIAFLRLAEVFGIPNDIVAFFKFLISLPIVLAVLILLFKKPAVMGVLPDLPYRIYRVFYTMMDRLYYAAVIFTFLTGLLWSFGYRNLAEFLWIRTWGVAGAFLLIMVIYHNLHKDLRNWILRKDLADKPAWNFYRSVHTVLLFVAFTISAVIILRLLGLLLPLILLISFPLLTIGKVIVSVWMILKAVLILMAFVFLSGLVRTYLDYKVYPKLGLEEGLAYSLNTLLGYFILIAAILFALRAVGFSLEVLLVFGGAIGVGIGLGLQNIAANFIGGLSLIFGGKVRKGDWIQVGERLGYVEAVGLGATRIRTRDNIEYVMPNSTLISNTVINYTISDPEIRIHIPVGVAYSSNPREIEAILRRVAEANGNISKTRKPQVWFVQYADSSLNFELLVWIDIRRFSDKEIQSQLYFQIFEALDRAGIEIPFPQRDIHIRTGPANTDLEAQKEEAIRVQVRKR